jgi:tRNA(fMet)-specific endonuclease VapC
LKAILRGDVLSPIPLFTYPKAGKPLLRIYADQGIGVIDKTVLDIAVMERLKLQEKGFNIEDDDLLIAAYCINHNLPLVTNNTKHFINMKHLKILNWAE